MSKPSPRSRFARVDPPPLKGGGAEASLERELAPLPPKGGRGVGERGRKQILRNRAKSMRSRPTPAEHRLWQIIRAKRLAGYKFKRQLAIDHYIADFVCLQRRVIIEADGGQHAGSATDSARDAYLKARGFRVLRFWNSDIFENENGVLTSILNALDAPLPNPSPVSEGPSGASHA